MVAILLTMMASCQAPREMTLANGTVYRDLGSIGGDTTAFFEGETAILRNKHSKSFQDFLQAAAAMYASGRAAKVDIARSAERTEASLANSSARVEQAKLDAATEALRIQARTEGLRILNPPVAP